MNQWTTDLYGYYRNKKFTDFWDNAEDFLEDYKNNGIPAKLSDLNATTLFYLLYARYGNSTIASSDENQFKWKLFSTIFQYGPAWQKRLELQDEATKLKIEDVMKDGGMAIYNHAFNPSTAPKTDEDGEHIMDYINDQNVTKYKKSRVDAIAIINSLVETDVTEEFIAKFKKLFLTVVAPESELWYVTDLEQEEQE